MNTFDVIVIMALFIIIILLIFLKLINNTSFSDNNIDNQIKKLLEQKEKFTVSDAQDFNNYAKLKAEVKSMPNNFDESTLINPDQSKIVDYKNQNKNNIMITPKDQPKINTQKNEKSFISSSDFGWEQPWPIVACANSSIENRFRTGPKHLLPYQISCGYANKITAENYYKTHFQAQAIGLNDTAVRGANYDRYNSFSHPALITQTTRILSQNTKGLYEPNAQYKNIPTGSNYSFNNGGSPVTSNSSNSLVSSAYALGGPVVGMP